jgi:hypothetical protein
LLCPLVIAATNQGKEIIRGKLQTQNTVNLIDENDDGLLNLN